MKRILSILDFKNNTSEMAVSLVLVVVLFFAGMASFASAATQAVTLTVTVNQALTFAITNNNFSTINPGTPVMATTTLIVNTNDTGGYFVSLSGTNAGNAGTYNLQNGSYSIPDQNQWVPGTATTSAGNAVRIGSLTNSQQVLAFRVMSASSTNGGPFLATTWWGTQDNYLVDSANTLYAGISSSTIQRNIGNTDVYNGAAQINTVQYYLNVAPTQAVGSYSAPLTYTATGN